MWDQLRNAASYEGVIGAYAMPDCHVGFGIPVGCVVVTEDTVIQAGSGYDISCGVVYLKTNLTAKNVRGWYQRERWVREVEKRMIKSQDWTLRPKPQVDAKVVGTGVGLAALAAMKNKIANASMFPSPTADEAVHLGFADWLINNTRGQDPDLKEFLHAVVYVRPEFLSENTDLCKRMIGAVVKSAAWIRSVSVEEVAQAIRPFFASLDEKVFLSALGNVREAVIPNGRMSAAGSDAYQKVLLQTGHLKETVAFDAVFTNQYLPA